jgi:hypothetical protein
VEYNFKANTETLGAEFFAHDNLPSLSTERNTSEQVHLCFEAKKCKSFEAVFD